MCLKKPEVLQKNDSLKKTFLVLIVRQQQEIKTLTEEVKGTSKAAFLGSKGDKEKSLKFDFQCKYLWSVLVSFVVSSFCCQAGCIGLDSGTSWEFTKNKKIYLNRGFPYTGK